MLHGVEGGEGGREEKRREKVGGKGIEEKRGKGGKKMREDGRKKPVG